MAKNAFSSDVLIVDLDGTLIKSDLLHEYFWGALGCDWIARFAAARALFGGRAEIKDLLAKRFEIDAARLPFREEVANKVFHAVETGRDVVYVKSLWRLIMLIIRNIPERIFKRLDI